LDVAGELLRVVEIAIEETRVLDPLLGMTQFVQEGNVVVHVGLHATRLLGLESCVEVEVHHAPAGSRGENLIPCRYITCPALANERVQTNTAGQVVLKLKTPWRDGTTQAW